MTLVKKQDSNFTGLSYAVEVSPGVVDGTVTWYPLEPNSYKVFGADVKTKQRMPINATRQLKKAVVVDLDAQGGFIQDLTASNFQDIAQCFLYANLRTKTELAVATVDGTAHAYNPASGGAGYTAGDLLFAKGFADAANNGLKVVSGTPSSTVVDVTDTGVITATTQTGIISRVGVQFATGALAVATTAGYPTLTSSGRTFDTLGLIPGEFIYIGDDVTGNSFATAANNGFARVRTVTSGTLTLDKTQGTMVNDTGTGKTVRIYFGRVLKNESDPTLIHKRSIQLERTLGYTDDSNQTQIQSEYLIRTLANQLKIDMKTADIIRLEMDFLSTRNELRDGVTGVKVGTRATLVDADAFNSTSDVAFTKMAIVTAGAAAPTPLFGYFTDLAIDVKNNLKQNKAVSVLGAFDSTPGFFQVAAQVTAYFTDIAEMQAVIANDSVTVETHLVKFNRGITIDLPLVVMSKAMADVKLNEPIYIPLMSDAATAKLIDPNLDYTMLLVFWDYLPTVAG